MRSRMPGAILVVAILIGASPVLAEVLPPPVPEDISVQAGATGSTLEVQQGENFAVSLQSNPSTGGRWVVAEKPDFVDAAGVHTGPVNTPPANGRPMIGAPIWNVLLFTANAAGSGTLTLELHGPGATAPVWQTYTITINAH